MKRGLVVLFTLLVARSASAQVHWDAGASIGVVRRIYTGGTGDGGFGPVAGLQAHVALFPLIRVGGYVSHDLSPTNDGADARNITSAGLRLKVGSPWPHGGAWHAWAFLGVGYVGVYAPSYHRGLSIENGGSSAQADALVSGAGGSHVEIPLGLGIGYRFWKPWELTLEVGSRFGFGFAGSLYQDPGRAAWVAGAGQTRLAPVGNDAVAPFAVLGVSLDE